MAEPATLVVFGAHGQVGGALNATPVPEGWRLLALDRAAADITCPGDVARVLAGLRRGVVVNLAAYTQVDQAETEREQAFAVNCGGAGVVAHAAAQQDFPVIHLSTDYVFPGTLAHPLTEASPTHPHSVYGASKLAGEAAVLEANPCALILRTSWVFGVQGANFVKSILRRAMAQPELGVVADQIGAPTPAPAIAATLWTLAARLSAHSEPADFGIFHYCGDQPVSWHGFAEEILAGASALGHGVGRIRPISTADYPLPAKRPSYSVLDCSKLTRRHGIAQPSWRRSLQRLLPQIIEAL